MALTPISPRRGSGSSLSSISPFHITVDRAKGFVSQSTFGVTQEHQHPCSDADRGSTRRCITTGFGLSIFMAAMT